MKEYSLSSLVCAAALLFGGLLPAGAARAQQTGVPEGDGADEATYVLDADTLGRYRLEAGAARRSSSGTGLQRVRRRVRQLRGGGGGGRRLAQPRVVPQPYAPSAAAAPPSSGVRYEGRPGGRGAYGQGDPTALLRELQSTRRLDDLRDALRDLEARRRALRGGTGAPEADAEERVPIPEEGIAVRPETPPPPTGARVERAFLETGLFRASNVNFEFDRSTLLPAAEPTLAAVGDVLARYPDLRLEVQGHTDGRGPAAYNEQLAQRRAETVAQDLQDRFGLAASRLTPVGFGEAQPIASDATETGRALNRRVTFRVLTAEALRDAPAPSGDLREAIREAVRSGFDAAEDDS